jgi:hypothetical protein
MQGPSDRTGASGAEQLDRAGPHTCYSRTGREGTPRSHAWSKCVIFCAKERTPVHRVFRPTLASWANKRVFAQLHAATPGSK